MRGFVQRAKTLLNLTIKTQQLGKLRFEVCIPRARRAVRRKVHSHLVDSIKRIALLCLRPANKETAFRHPELQALLGTMLDQLSRHLPRGFDLAAHLVGERRH